MCPPCPLVSGWDQMYEYNPETYAWTKAAPIQVPRRGSAVCTLKGKIYIIGIIPVVNGSLFHDNSTPTTL